MARVPLYKKAETELLRRIHCGDWPEGTRIGNEFELAEDFGVSQGTMRRALMAVEAMGLLRRKPGRGTIVTAPPAANTPPAAARAGLTLPDGAPLPLDVFRARLLTRTADGTGPGALTGPVHELTRTLKSGGDRVALEEILLPADLVPDMVEDQPADVGDLLSALNLQASHFADTLTSEMTSMADAVALSCDRHTALLCLTRIAFNPDGEVLAVQSLRMIGPVAYTGTAGR